MALVNAVMNPGFHKMLGSSCITGGLSRRVQLHEVSYITFISFVSDNLALKSS
jgi:hypothetical protein